MSDKTQTLTMTRDDGITIVLFHNETTGLIVVDIVAADELSGIEVVREAHNFADPFLGGSGE